MLSKKIPLPEVLKKKLEFGNREQIDALNEIEKKIAEQEDKTGYKLAGNLKLYKVGIQWTGANTEEIWASSEDEALKIAEAKTDIDGIDLWTANIFEIRYRIKGVNNGKV